MRIIYAPEGVEPQTWEVDPRRLMVVELEAIEKVTGLTFVQWGEMLSKGSPTALRSLVWILRKRYENPTLQYADVDFAIGDLTFEADEEETDPKEAQPAADGV